MKVLGRGWQYTVYDLGGGRVLKRHNSALAACYIMLHDSFPYIHHPLWVLPRLHREAQAAACRSLSTLRSHTLEPWMLANPTLRDDDSYEQDKVTPLDLLLRSASREEGERLIDAFVAFNRELVSAHLIDKSFDIGNNFGLDSQRRVVLIDLGELVCEREAIEAQMRARIWSAHYVLSGVPQRLHAYFLAKMDEAFMSTPQSGVLS